MFKKGKISTRDFLCSSISQEFHFWHQLQIYIKGFDDSKNLTQINNIKMKSIAICVKYIQDHFVFSGYLLKKIRCLNKFAAAAVLEVIPWKSAFSNYNLNCFVLFVPVGKTIDWWDFLNLSFG